MAALITSYLIPLIKRKADAEKLETIRTWVTIAVYAAEQIFNAPGLGEDKKAYVIDFLTDHGFVIDEEEIENMIEAAVLEMKNSL